MEKYPPVIKINNQIGIGTNLVFFIAIALIRLAKLHDYIPVFSINRREFLTIMRKNC